MKPVRVTISTIALTALILSLFLVPLPVSRVRQLGVVQVRPEALVKVYVPFPGGVLRDLKVRDGQTVNKGDLLAVFSNLDSELQLAQQKEERDLNFRAFNDLNQLLVEHHLQEEQPNVSSDTRTQLQRQITEAQGKFKTAARIVSALESQAARMEVKAERDGVIMDPPRIDAIGREYEKGEILCKIADPSRLRVLMPVTPDDFKILDRDLHQVPDLPVTIRVQGHAERTWKGRLWAKDLPQTEAARIPVQLTNKAGGNIAVKPETGNSKRDQEGSQVPQDQQFLVPIELLDPDQSVSPGTLAYVKVSCRYRTVAWWAWRTFSSKFNLGMDPMDWLPERLR